MNETIEIKNVDVELLDKQRLVLGEYTIQYADIMEPEVLEALEGILGMLDAWSDARRPDLPAKYSHWFPKEGHVYPKGAITVIGLADNNTRVQYAIDGYCEVYSASPEAFLARFRPLSEAERQVPVPAELAYFGFDEGPLILGFTYGDRWNGWGLPYVEKESFRKWIEASGDIFDSEYSYFKFEGDTLIHHTPESETEDGKPLDEPVQSTQLEYEGHTYEIYHVGNGWCWNQYDLATSEDVNFDDPFPQVFIPEGLEETHLAFMVRRHKRMQEAEE